MVSVVPMTRDGTSKLPKFVFTIVYLNFFLQAFEAQFTHGNLQVDEEDGTVRTSVRLNGQHERDVTIR